MEKERDDDLYDRLNEILLEQGDRYFDPDDMSVDGDDVLKAIIADRDKAYEQLNIMMRPFPDDEIDAIRLENCELVQRMGKLKAESGLVFAASTALSNQWCEKDLERLRELSKALTAVESGENDDER